MAASSKTHAKEEPESPKTRFFFLSAFCGHGSVAFGPTNSLAGALFSCHLFLCEQIEVRNAEFRPAASLSTWCIYTQEP